MAGRKRGRVTEPGHTEGPLTGARFENILIFTRDLERMLAFYRDVLGLKVGHSSDHFAELAAGGGAGISLHAGSGGPLTVDADLMIEFIVQDIEAVAASLRAKGVSVGPIRDEPFGRISRFVDPEGHSIGLEQPRS